LMMKYVELKSENFVNEVNNRRIVEEHDKCYQSMRIMETGKLEPI